MAPGRPVVSIGIQPQIALYSVILGSVCAFSWYTEKYHRNEGNLDERIQKMYLETSNESQSKMPQMAAVIRGQSTTLDGRMDKLVWGGKAQLKNGSENNNNNNGTDGLLLPSIATDDDDDTTISSGSGLDEKPVRKRRKRKRKKDRSKPESSEGKRQMEEEALEQQKQLLLRSSIAGVAVGAISVAALSALLAGGGRK